MTEEQLKQEIYNVLNTHNPTTCTDKPCKAVTTLMSLFANQLELAKIEAKMDEVNNMPAIYVQYAIPRLFELQSELTKQKDLLTKESK